MAATAGVNSVMNPELEPGEHCKSRQRLRSPKDDRPYGADPLACSLEKSPRPCFFCFNAYGLVVHVGGNDA